MSSPTGTTAFDEAVFNFQSLMMDAGRSKEAYDFLVSVRPDITDFGVIPPDIQGAIMQWSCLELMTGFEPIETSKAAWMKMARSLDELGFPWRGPGDWGALDHLVMSGDTGAAIEEYLEFNLKKPLAEQPEIRRLEARVFLAGVYADPRVVARHAELQQEFEQLRQQVAEMLQKPEWNR